MFVATRVLFLFQFSFNLVSALGYVDNVIFIVGNFQLFSGLFQETKEGGVLFPAPGMPFQSLQWCGGGRLLASLDLGADPEHRAPHPKSFVLM